MADLRLWVISKAEYDEETPGYSTLATDFPHVIGPTEEYDTVTGLSRPWGRHPETGEPLIVTEVTRYVSEVVTPGVKSSSQLLTPPKDAVPAVAVVAAIVPTLAVAQAIHGSTKHRVLAFEMVDASEPPVSGWGPDDQFTSQRWTQIRNGLVYLGMPAATIDNWRAAHPNATPREFYQVLKTYIEGLS